MACKTADNINHAQWLGVLLCEGAAAMACVHEEAGCEAAEDEDLRPVVARILEDKAAEVASSVKAALGRTDIEEYSVQVSMGLRARKEALAILFPSEEE